MKLLKILSVLLLLLTPVVFAGEVDWTGLIHSQLPFLHPKTEFWNAYSGSNPGHGEPHQLIGKFPDGPRVEVKTAEDLASFVAEIRTPEEALAYVRFLSDPPERLDHPLPTLVSFREIKAEGFAAFAAPELKRCGVSEPVVTKSNSGSGSPLFTIERWVVSFDQLAKGKRQGDTVTYPEITRVREHVDAKGGYRCQSGIVQVQDLAGSQPMRLLD